MDINKLSLFLGLLVGDGYISNRNNGNGYPTYSINFYNTKKLFVELFDYLYFDLFNKNGKISFRSRPNRKDLYEFNSYSRDIFNFIVYSLNVPYGKKAKIVRIPKIVLNSNNKSKIYFFLGLLLSDGFVNKRGNIGFHMASKGLLEDLSLLIKEVWGYDKLVKEVIQKDKYYSYQLNLNIDESNKILNHLCRDRITWYCTDSVELLSLKCKP